MPAGSDNKMSAGWKFDNSYVRLPEALYSRVAPVPVVRPAVAIFNSSLAEELGLDPGAIGDDRWAEIFAGNRLPPGAEPIAQAYAGHQFGHFTNLGDGRALMLGEQITPRGERFDIALKGSGRTPYSRMGDGRAALGPMLREYIVSEAMHALGIPTTRSVAVVKTGETVVREEPLPGAVLVRVASSHIRVGTFEYAAASGDVSAVRALVDHTLQRHYPELAGADNRALALLQGVCERQAALVARWMLVGFIHGVMNTDNMAVSGETIDYGPCAFMDVYDAGTVFSSIDRYGRYAYGNQPQVAQWNLARFAESLLPLLDDDRDHAVALGEEAVGEFAASFERYWADGLRAKLGLCGAEEGDVFLAKELLAVMREAGADFTNTFAALTEAAAGGALTGILRGEACRDWLGRWKARLARQVRKPAESAALMRAANPAIIPRNHRVEEALEAAVERDDFSVMEKLLGVLSAPFEATPENAEYRIPPGPEARGYRTFCGT